MKLSYDEAYKELEEILNAIKSNEVKIDELDTKVLRARALLDHCQKRLKKITKNIDDAFEA